MPETSSLEKRGIFVALPVYAMVFLSGFAGLVYQVLWMKELGLLFGNTSHAAATTLASFFLGLACGSWVWGKRSARTKNPLRTYAVLEVGIALTALVYFWVVSVFYAIYPHVYQSLGSGVILYATKFILAMALIFPPAFFMGGTIPVIGQFMILQKNKFGVTSAKLYGINTLGAALGAFLTGFYFVFLFGFDRTCIGAIGISLTIALISFLMSLSKSARLVPVVVSTSTTDSVMKTESPTPKKGKSKKARKQQNKTEKDTDKSALLHADSKTIGMIAFLSGFGVLALEVLWTRIFAQIHENSVYSFSSVLVIVLLSLSLGSLIAAQLTRLKKSPVQVLAILMVISGIAVTYSPQLFMWVTNDLEMLTAPVAFSKYIIEVYLKGLGTIGVPCLALGTIFPYLMKIEEHHAETPGKSLGRLATINTVGAILGSLLCGFVFITTFGMWHTMQVIGWLYLVTGIFLTAKTQQANVPLTAVAGLALLLSFFVFNPSHLELDIIAHQKKPEPGAPAGPSPGKPVKIWETSGCTVIVVEHKLEEGVQRTETHYEIKVNSAYTLGSTMPSAARSQRKQSEVPLMAYPDTRSVFYLGLGTGMTAGAALDKRFNVQRLLACELVPEVIEAAKQYIAKPQDFTNGLFDSDRAEVIADDGRHYLMATKETFDMINADLFLPYRNGAGSLYSQEHFQSVKARLNPGGVFVQWVPMYQVTDKEFGIMVRTMLSVFDQVTLWRNNFQVGGEKLALVGHLDSTPLPKVNRTANLAKSRAVAEASIHDLPSLENIYFLLEFEPWFDELTVLFHYCGNLTKVEEAEGLFSDYPINTDDKPVIEYLAPRSLRETPGEGGYPVKLVGPRLVELLEKIQAACPPETDPMLANRSDENRRLPRAGLAFHKVWTHFPRRGGDYPFADDKKWKAAWKTFVKEWTNR